MMRQEHEDEYPLDMDMDAWAENVDAIVAGEHVPSNDDDELLRLASRLNTALTPLNDMRKAAEQRVGSDGRRIEGGRKGRRRAVYPPTALAYGMLSLVRRGTTRLRPLITQSTPSGIARPFLSHRLSRPTLLVVALVCCVLLLVGNGAFMAVRNGLAQVWHTSTSLDQLHGISVDMLERPHNGVKPLPLLPTTVPADMQGATYGVITDASNPNVLVTFVANYRVRGQDVLLYEQPSAVAFPAANAQTVQIGAIDGQLFQDDTGTNALQWYQHGMICQITSKLPVERLVTLASTFQQIKSWDLIV